MKKGVAFMRKHPVYHATVHAIGGVGVGILLASYLAGMNPIAIGLTFVIISLLGHAYTWFA